jgi:uncharacterized circularly permuted ATP-grasp superfamily protein
VEEEKGHFSHLLFMGLRDYWGAQHLVRDGLIPESICESHESAWR